MKYFYIIALLFVTAVAQAQIVDIPDANFKSALINDLVVDTNNDGTYDSDVDLNDDGEIQLSEALAVTSMDVSFKDIVSLEGISSFTNITSLFCTDNPLSSLDLSALIGLETLGCWDNDEIVSLDFSANINLVSLECDCNDLLVNLNISNGNNTSLTKMWADCNPSLLCIEVDDENYANNQTCGGGIDWCKEAFASYSEVCELGTNDYSSIFFKLFPNPVQNVLNVQSKGQIQSVKIYSLHGILVKEVSVSNIDVSRFSTGIYFVQVSIGGKKSVKKFVKA